MGKVSLVVAFIVILALGINENRVEGGNMMMGRKHSNAPITFCHGLNECARFCNFFGYQVTCGCKDDHTCCCEAPKHSPPSYVIP
ncbi:hypothetical protein ABFS83_05G078000 [Erythranthe nasuta]